MTLPEPPKKLIVTNQQYGDGWYENNNGEITHHKQWPILSHDRGDGTWEVFNPAYWVWLRDKDDAAAKTNAKGE